MCPISIGVNSGGGRFGVSPRPPRFWDGGSWSVHKILSFPLMYRNMR